MKEKEELDNVLELAPEEHKSLTEEDKELLMKGIRPEWMAYDMFRHIRKMSKAAMKQYLKGKLIHLSKEIIKKDNKTIVKTYPPYVKKSEKE